MEARSPSLRIGIYARYSSDLQNASSVDDQVRLCRHLIDKQFGGAPDVLVFKDAAISGATMERPGMRRLLRAAEAGKITLVVAEGLDRLSRNLRDSAAIYEMLGYHGVSIWTGHEGRITELHVGVKGAMNALFLKDMREKVRRGQSARIAAGFASSSCPYGYRVVRGVVDERGRNVNGVREINPAQAEVVRRIFTDYAAGRTIPQLIEALNAEGIPAPAGGLWKRSALAGSPKKAEGILLNEVYIGNLVYNRTRITRDPVTGRKRYAINPEEEWTRTHVPELRIVDDATWQKAQALHRRRRVETALKLPTRKGKVPRILSSHNQHALTGWVKCGWCGGLKSLANESRYLCSTHRYAKQCKNSRGIKEPVLMDATFTALRDRVEHGPEFRTVFLAAYAKDATAAQTLEKEVTAIREKIDALMELVEKGVDREHVTERILTLQDELHEAREKMKRERPPALPDETSLRATLLAAIFDLEHNASIEEQRTVFGMLLSSITLTPIPDRSRGETIDIELREDGWPEFWRTITAQ